MIGMMKAVARFFIRTFTRIRCLRKGSRIAGYIDKARFGSNCRVERACHVQRCAVGSWCNIRKNAILNDSTLGDYCSIQQSVMIANADIGSFCGIADFSRIGAENHPLDRVTTSKVTYWPSLGMVDELDMEFLMRRYNTRTSIGSDVWIGHGSIVLPGVAIGHGAVVGAGSVVTKSVEPYAIVAGNPARLIRMRFNPETVKTLLSTRWWTWDLGLIKERIKDFRDPVLFCRKYGQEN